ncbi:MAG: hypothetical protein ABRQ37_25860 [Candidatus Eremiobacterota bacterium]
MRQSREKNEVRIKDENGKHVKYKKGDKKGQYRTRKIKPTWPGKILQESGLLMDSITPDFDETSAMVGTNNMPRLISSETPIEISRRGNIFISEGMPDFKPEFL